MLYVAETSSANFPDFPLCTVWTMQFIATPVQKKWVPVNILSTTSKQAVNYPMLSVIKLLLLRS